MANWQPALDVLIGLVALQIGYQLCIGPWRYRFAERPGDSAPAPVTRRRQASFLAGILALGLALATPIDGLASQMQSMHMVQHLLITLIGPPLLLIGTPGWLLRPALRWPLVYRLARQVTRARPAFAIGTLTFLLWHFPIPYDAALRYQPLHIAEHLTMIVAATIMWWPVLGMLPELPRLSPPLQMLYVFLQTLPGALLGVILAMASVPLYPTYLGTARPAGLTVMADQQLAGLIMWVGTNIYWLAVLTAVFFSWAARDEDDLRGELARDRAPLTRAPARQLRRGDPATSDQPAPADHAGV